MADTQPTTLDLNTLTLAHGAHDTPDDGMCLIEAAAYWAHEPFSDHPACVSPVIAAFGRSWNDALLEEDRNRLLKRYVPLIVGTNTGPEDDGIRAWMSLDWLVRQYTPVWLRAAGLNDQAASLAGLPEFRAGMDVSSVRPAIEAARRDAVAARDAARDALRPSVVELQVSACDLLDRMIAVGRTP